jgi:hypothetical protein
MERDHSIGEGPHNLSSGRSLYRTNLLEDQNPASTIEFAEFLIDPFEEWRSFTTNTSPRCVGENTQSN